MKDRSGRVIGFEKLNFLVPNQMLSTWPWRPHAPDVAGSWFAAGDCLQNVSTTPAEYGGLARTEADDERLVNGWNSKH
jgi:hypothetical protein